MSPSSSYRTVGDAVFVKPGRRGGNVHIRPRPGAPATTCGRFIRAGWTNLAERSQPSVRKWCLLVCESDERYGLVHEAVGVG